MKTFKRISMDEIAVDGIIYNVDPSKKMLLKSQESGLEIYSVKLYGVTYYPCGINRS